MHESIVSRETGKGLRNRKGVRLVVNREMLHCTEGRKGAERMYLILFDKIRESIAKRGWLITLGIVIIIIAIYLEWVHDCDEFYYVNGMICNNCDGGCRPDLYGGNL